LALPVVETRVPGPHSAAEFDAEALHLAPGTQSVALFSRLCIERGEGEAHPRAAAAALARATELREAIYPILSAEARGEPVPDDALAGLNAHLPEALGALRVEPGSGGYRWRFDHGKTDLAPMLAPILRSAAELLTSPALGRVRECDSDTCWWLFLDGSKSGTRRWCDMKVCGNREKARRHHKRHKAS
jgi:predicted RNA-binding Zn ribbon-like protein